MGKNVEDDFVCRRGGKKSYHEINNWGRGTKEGEGRVGLVGEGGVRVVGCRGCLNLMQCGNGPDHGREAGAAADILLSRWKQNLNWGMVYLTSEERKK